MTEIQRVLFVQGAGGGTYDEWDDKLVDSLRAELGSRYEVRYPRMPEEDDPSAATWVPEISKQLEDLGDGAVVVGHSVGAAILLHALASGAPDRPIGAIVLLAAPFVGPGGWPGDEFELTNDVGDRLPRGVPVHVFFGLDDETVPPSRRPVCQVHSAGAASSAPRYRSPARERSR